MILSLIALNVMVTSRSDVGGVRFPQAPGHFKNALTIGQVIRVRGYRRSVTSHERYEAADAEICDDRPQVSFQTGRLHAILSAGSQDIAFESTGYGRLIMISRPVVAPSGYRASYYVVSVSLANCLPRSGYSDCSFSAQSSREIAPVDHGIVRVDDARPNDDALSNQLLIEAKKSIGEVNFWCRVRSVVKHRITGIPYGQ